MPRSLAATFRHRWGHIGGDGHVARSRGIAFNEDIGAWDTCGRSRDGLRPGLGADTSGVVDGRASAFNQDISGWAVDKRHGYGQHVQERLGLRPGPRLVRGRRRGPDYYAFDGTKLRVRFTSCGAHGAAVTSPSTGNVMANWKIKNCSCGVALGRDGRRGDVRPHFDVGDIGGDGHVWNRFAARTSRTHLRRHDDGRVQTRRSTRTSVQRSTSVKEMASVL